MPRKRWLLLFCGTLAAIAPALAETHQATGVKVGEVTPSSALVWMRCTAHGRRATEGTLIVGHGAASAPADLRADTLRFACPGMPGKVRLRYGKDEHLADARATDWINVSSATDYAHVFKLQGLEPATAYHYSAETADPSGAPHDALRGAFKTAPPPDRPADAAFTVITGQMYADLDDPDGFLIYDAMLAVKPDFLVLTGDTVYYDNEQPVARSADLARYHWHRMYSLPRLVRFHQQVPAYWEKDDHDTYYNDCWPNMRMEQMGTLTFEQGQALFREQAPVPETMYRTLRWGRDLQIWLVEGRDFRSPNTMPDGPDKTIWGRQQKRWLEETLLASDATFKVLVSPTPIVGPDRGNKQDNHANRAFAHEGDEIRRWIRDHFPNGGLLLACGDRHWQYHSVDPATGVQEFSCGPASDAHAGGSLGADPEYHRFHRVGGGFLQVRVASAATAASARLRMSFHDVFGKVVYQAVMPPVAPAK